jgi:hypothetical protein
MRRDDFEALVIQAKAWCRTLGGTLDACQMEE